jgi:hypothetical protein
MRSAALIAFAFALAPTSALADTVKSANWSGYAVHRTGVSFHHVQGSWTQPSAVCTRGQSTYSAFWVGLGGYSTGSTALEQIGTELDCTVSGRVSSTAWYELVPSPSRAVRITVRPGDRMSASVTVTGRRVTLRLADATRHETFSKTMTVSTVDTGSAEWIVEAPSGCTTTGMCQPLPLTDFGAVRFTADSARAGGHRGAISSGWWDTTKVVLSPDAPTFIASGAASQSTPSALQASATAFAVHYSQTTSTVASRRATAASATNRVQPGGVRR